MTTRDELIEKVALKISDSFPNMRLTPTSAAIPVAKAAIAVVLEEAAKVAESREGKWHSDLANGCARDIAAAIRALGKE